jgi:predicted enzyme related to lactoylglutathione lyase
VEVLNLPRDQDVSLCALSQTVDDVDKVAKNVVDMGGKILKPAFDIPEVGRFCVLQDPQGAVLCAMTYLNK